MAKFDPKVVDTDDDEPTGEPEETPEHGQEPSRPAGEPKPFSALDALIQEEESKIKAADKTKKDLLSKVLDQDFTEVTSRHRLEELKGFKQLTLDQHRRTLLEAAGENPDQAKPPEETPAAEAKPEPPANPEPVPTVDRAKPESEVESPPVAANNRLSPELDPGEEPETKSPKGINALLVIVAFLAGLFIIGLGWNWVNEAGIQTRTGEGKLQKAALYGFAILAGVLVAYWPWYSWRRSSREESAEEA